MQTVGTPALWTSFIVFVLAAVALDLLVFHRRGHKVGVPEALMWTAVWVGLAVAFGVWIHVEFGSTAALEFGTGYLIEKALSVDNLFVFMIIFTYFAVPEEQQQRVLLWGILGAMVMRAVFIFAGVALIAMFHWTIYVFGAFLVLTALRLMFGKDSSTDPENNPMVKLFSRVVPTAPRYHGKKFFVVENGRRVATPLFVVLLVIETTDVMFAVDSVPAIFAITSDPFLIFTSNVFAILGLRALYFALAGMMEKLHFLQHGLGAVLLFVGIKMLISDFYHVPILISLGIICTLLLSAVLASLLIEDRSKVAEDPGEE